MHKIKTCLSKSILATFFVLATSLTALASTPKTSALFEKLDADHDGTLDLAETKSAAAERFGALDTDHDGTLDPTEAAKAAIGKKEFAKLDTAKKGVLDKDQFLSMVEKEFATADKDHDGTLSKDEVDAKPGKQLAGMIE